MQGASDRRRSGKRAGRAQRAKQKARAAPEPDATAHAAASSHARLAGDWGLERLESIGYYT